jgi:hypothetical protein
LTSDFVNCLLEGVSVFLMAAEVGGSDEGVATVAVFNGG